MADRGPGSVRGGIHAAAVWAGICLALAACAHRPRAEQPRQKVAVVQRARDLVQATGQPQAAAQADSLVLESIYFDYRKDQLRPDQQKVLLRHAEHLKAHPAAKVTLVGHCDDRGTSEFNKVLGAKRAEQVMKFLAGQGIATDRFKVLSLGEEQPVDRGKSSAARARNRRVEFAVGP